MSHKSTCWSNLLRDRDFYLLLLSIDQELAAEVRAQGCPVCGSALHFARYERKPRGVPEGLPEAYDYRESLCCSADGCRRRVLPPSLRFFGRRVYAAAVFVLACVMVSGITEKRAAVLRDLVGVNIRTLARWRSWWQKSFPQTPFWREARGRFAPPPPEESGLPASLLERFSQTPEPQRLLALLRFLQSVTPATR